MKKAGITLLLIIYHALLYFFIVHARLVACNAVESRVDVITGVGLALPLALVAIVTGCMTAFTTLAIFRDKKIDKYSIGVPLIFIWSALLFFLTISSMQCPADIYA